MAEGQRDKERKIDRRIKTEEGKVTHEGRMRWRALLIISVIQGKLNLL